jgi:hypothetical protein
MQIGLGCLFNSGRKGEFPAIGLTGVDGLNLSLTEKRRKRTGRNMKTLAIDFDGCLSAYTGWKGPDRLDPPLPGAVEALRGYLKHYEVVIFTTRAALIGGQTALRLWLKEAGFSDEEINALRITDTKPPAWLYIDDRCYLFRGTFPSIAEIEAFKPYWDIKT